MKRIAMASLLTAATAASALAAEPAALRVTVTGFDDGKPIPAKFAYCTPDGKGHTGNGGNISPAIHWSDGPAGTKSYAIIVVDPDVPANFENANQAGKVIAADAPRQNFYHWVLVDIPATTTSLSEGQDSKGVTQGGKPVGKTAYGVNGQNDYAKVGKGANGGYDGPCPPWNDERLHHYHFAVYALDVPSLKLSGEFKGKEAEDAMAGHILAKGEVVGTYTDNQQMIAK